jgi:GTPase
MEKNDSFSSTRKDKETRISVVGNVDHKESTIDGLLSKGVNDDGRGAARSSVFNFNQELNNDKTSSIGSKLWDSGISFNTLLQTNILLITKKVMDSNCQ